MYAPEPETSSSAAVAPAHAGALAARRAGRDVGLGADDRLDAGRGRLLPEVVGAEVVAVVGDRDRRHPLLDRGLHQVGRRAPRRRASSTRCARAGARRNRSAHESSLEGSSPPRVKSHPNRDVSPRAGRRVRVAGRPGMPVSKSTRSPVPGCRNPSLIACSHCRLEPEPGASVGSAP